MSFSDWYENQQEQDAIAAAMKGIQPSTLDEHNLLKKGLTDTRLWFKPAEEIIADLFLNEPVTHERMTVTSPPFPNEDGSYSFITESPSGTRWRHTIRTEEL